MHKVQKIDLTRPFFRFTDEYGGLKNQRILAGRIRASGQRSVVLSRGSVSCCLELKPVNVVQIAKVTLDAITEADAANDESGLILTICELLREFKATGLTTA